MYSGESASRALACRIFGQRDAGTLPLRRSSPLIEACEAILAGYVERDGPTLAYGGDSAHYNVVRDHLQLPDRESST